MNCYKQHARWLSPLRRSDNFVAVQQNGRCVHLQLAFNPSALGFDRIIAAEPTKDRHWQRLRVARWWIDREVQANGSNKCLIGVHVMRR